MSTEYRPEIDGLRAIAILPVIAYHGGLAGFPGGFVGVDVFFVISGYLITGILVGDLAKEQFSIAHFYERRARRILPALFFVLAFTAVMALILLIPPAFVAYSESVLAVVLFLSNMLFISEVDYFAPGADETVLLHTWSLSVEEQFYILFPFLLWGLWRIGKRRALFWGVACVTVFSFVFSEYAWREISAAQSFYFLPSRAWELGAGALCALTGPGHRPISGVLRETGALAGLAAIAVSVAFLDRTYPFPSYWALLPVGGSVAVVLWARTGTIAARLLSMKPVVAIGLISYSAYLWHHPVFAFARIGSVSEPSAATMTSLAILTLFLAWFSWRFVEKPFRPQDGQRPWLPLRWQVFSASLLGIGMFSAFAIWGYTSDGREALWLRNASEGERTSYALFRGVETTQRFSDDGGCRFNQEILDPETIARLSVCAEQHGPGLAIIGDSHAIDLADALIVAEQAPFIFGMTQGGCRPDVPDPACGYEDFASLVAEAPELFSHVVFEVAGQHLITGPGGRQAERIFEYHGLDTPMLPENIALRHDRVDAIAEFAELLAQNVPVRWLTPRIEPHLPAEYLLSHPCDHDFSLRPGQAAVFDRLATAIEIRASGLPGLTVLNQPELIGFTMPDDFMTCDALDWTDGDHLSTSGRAWLAARIGTSVWP